MRFCQPHSEGRRRSAASVLHLVVAQREANAVPQANVISKFSIWLERLMVLDVSLGPVDLLVDLELRALEM